MDVGSSSDKGQGSIPVGMTLQDERWKGAGQVKIWGQHQHQNHMMAMSSMPKEHQQELCKWKREGDGIRGRGRSQIRCDLQSKKFGFSSKCCGKCFSVLGWHDLIDIFESNRWRMGQEWSKNTSQEAFAAVRDTGVFALCLDKNQSYLFSTSNWRERDIPFLLPKLSQGESISIYPKILYR